ncbi:glycoside hydrolase family 43 protein [Metabacillus halosaccharovorans]|uniref:glycoside hydrolase family 43 protein n=1 Tax=Metabacillus halosaccharovorans TaxID=930124 RepID=UPI00204225C6|nr:glycoside hydrolase family 43 protein [Metabacillus halosaccharovorans]MCM3439267.1 glycoside hydrolase family 43 protein [Metabacillus halosaccharovorans]
MKYNNPVISGFHPDPSICNVGEDYYLVTSSFEYFPGVPIFHSKDLVNWKKIGHCLTRESQLDLKESKSSLGIFAPTIRYHNSKFYMITTNFTLRKNFFVWSEKPEGPWSEPIWLDWPGIDPSLLFEDNKVYLTGTQDIFSSETVGIYQAEIDIDTGTILTERKLIWEGSGGAYPEGPHLYKKNDYYYLLVAEGGTDYGHMVAVARSKNPYGPFESHPNNPILTHRSSDSPIQATGHADLIQYKDGSWWTVFLAVRPAPIFGGKTHHLGRETFLAPVDWTDNDWPIIQSEVELEMDARNLPVMDLNKWRYKDDFNEKELDVEWNFLRNPNQESLSLTEKPGFLTLYGTSVTLDDLDSPSFIGRRQEHFNCKVSTLLAFSPAQDGEEAGITVIMNEKFHYEIAIGIRNGLKKVFVRRRVGSLWKVEEEHEYNHDSIVLTIQAEPVHYTFTYNQPNDSDSTVLGKGECSLISSEVAGGHTGVYFGLYATGNGRDSDTPAHFDWFKYDPSYLSK